MNDHSEGHQPGNADGRTDESPPNVPHNRETLKFKISKQQCEPEAADGKRLDKIETALETMMQLFQNNNSFVQAAPASLANATSVHFERDNTNHAKHEDDALSLLPSDDAYQTDSSCSQQEEDRSGRQKRTSKESSLHDTLTDDIADLQKPSKNKNGINI